MIRFIHLWLYTPRCLVIDDKRTHTDTQTHTHTCAQAYTHTHTCMHAFTQSMIFIVQAIDRCVLLTSRIESPEVHLILDEFCPTSGAFCEAREHENMSVFHDRTSQHNATCTISLVRYIPTTLRLSGTLASETNIVGKHGDFHTLMIQWLHDGRGERGGAN